MLVYMCVCGYVSVKYRVCELFISNAVVLWLFSDSKCVVIK